MNHILAMEYRMADPDTTASVTSNWGAIAGAVGTALGVVYAFWDKIKGAVGTASTVESDALIALRQAADGWKALYDTALAQVATERALRETAEQRLTTTVQEMEGLRSEVASLRRDIEQLTATVDAYRKGTT